MNIQELDLVILKNLVSSKKNALEFSHEGSEKLLSPDTWKFAKLVLEYLKVYKELPTRKVLSERAKFSKNDALISYINDVFDRLEGVKIVEVEFKHNLEKLKSRYTEKLIYSLKDKLVADERIDLNKSINDITSTVSHIKNVNKNKVYDHKTIKEGFKEFRTSYTEKMNNPQHGRGLGTGFDFLDIATGGLRSPQVMLIGAESGVGKSLMLSALGYQLFMGENTLDMTSDFKEGNDVIYFSLEMSREDCQSRLMARACMIPQKEIRDATLPKEDLEKLSKFAKFINNYPYDFHIVDMSRGATIEMIELIYNNICEKSGRKPKIIIIDYLTLMDCDGEDQDWLKVGRIAEQLHEFCKITNTIVLTATQLNRGKPGNGQQSFGLDRIARSSLQAANVDYVLLLEKRPRERELPDMKCALVKNRHGEETEGTIYKKLNCCALLNKPLDDMSETNPNDISDMIE